MYYQRRPRRRLTDYIMPFLIIIIIIAIIVMGWRMLNRLFIDDSRITFNENVTVNIEQGSAKAMIVDESEWENLPDTNINFYSGEKLKTGADGKVSCTFFDQSIVRLDGSTEIEFVKLKRKKEDNIIEVYVPKGDIWAKIERITNPDSSFTIITDLLTIDSRSAILAVSAPGTVYIVNGSAQVSMKFDDEIIKTINLGVGQELMVDEQIIADINEGLERDLIFALDDVFKASSWYRWNMKKDGLISGFEEPAEEEDEVTGEEPADETVEETVVVGRLVSITKPSQNSATSKSTISLEGLYEPEKVGAIYINGKKASTSGSNKWKIYELSLSEGKNTLTVEAEDLSGVRSSLDPFVITYDDTPPATPVITEPGMNDETITIEDVEQEITGTVSDDTYAVIVNDYRLSKYVSGSGKFSYYAKIAYGNLEVGENEYTIYAEDKAGNQSEPAKIILVLDQETVDASGIETETEGEEPTVEEPVTETTTEPAEEPLPVSTSQGGVTITEPNGGESFTTTETEFDIKGAVPANTAKVEVNDYKLSLFNAGDTAYRYSAKSSLGNLEIGKKNEYTVKAFDADGNVLGSASITIDVQSGSASAPTITIPTSSGTYSTTLNELVIGGTIGKWIQKIYINDQLLSDYIPGSEQWRKTVTLTSGENKFTVYGTNNGDTTASVSITITYQP